MRQSNVRLAPYLPQVDREADPGLAALVDAWPTLPEPIRAGILAMVKAASSPKGAGRRVRGRERPSE